MRNFGKLAFSGSWGIQIISIYYRH